MSFAQPALGPNLLIVSFSSAKVTKHNEGGRVLPLLHYIEMLHFRHFFLVYTHPTLLINMYIKQPL